MNENANGDLKFTHVKGPAARRTGIPIDEMELQRGEAIRKRESLACSWAENQEPADLIALMSENANEYGFLVAHSHDAKVLEAVLKCGVANSLETLHYLTLNPLEEVAKRAQVLWYAVVDVYPPAVYEAFARVYQIRI